MKKHLHFILAAIVGILLASCAEKEMVTFHEGDLVAPALNSLTGTDYVLVENGTFDDFTYTPAGVGFSASIQYELFASLQGDGAKPKSLGKVTNKESITVDANTLNNVLIGLECAPDIAVPVDFYVTANWMSQSNKPVGFPTTSNVVSANVTPFYAEKTYKFLYFRGGFNGWGNTKEELRHRIYCFDEDDNTYRGTVYFGLNMEEHLTAGFKIADKDWKDFNFGADAAVSYDTDASVSKLVSGSTSGNIMNYPTYKYYSFELNVANLTLSKDFGFNQMGFIGVNGDWDNDVVMEYNPNLNRFYVDVDAAAAFEGKFRLDGAWDNNWGVGGAKGGDNISFPAGQYRVYFNFGDYKKPLSEVNPDMYGKEEPCFPDPEPEPEVKNWSLIGEIGDSNWDTDFDMSESNGVWSTTATIKGQFKLRFAGEWAKNRGADAEGDFKEVELDTQMPVKQDGINFKVAEEGLYMVAYDTLANVVTVSNMGNKWSLIGEVDGSGWDKDFFMTETDGVWTSDAVTFANKDGEVGSFKLRFNASWDDANTRGASEGDFVFEVGKEFDVVSPGQNIKAPSATDKYIVTYVPETNKVTITMALPQNQWSLIGGIEGTGWGTDFYMTKDPTGAWISDPVTIDGGFKIRFNNDWAVNRGGTMEAFGMRFAVTQDGANIELPTYDVKYQVVYYPDLEQIAVLPCTDAFSLIGQYDGHNWDYDVMMGYVETPNIWISDIFYVEKEAGFKIRQNCGWDTNFGGVLEAIGTPFSAVSGGDNITVPTTGYYYLVYDVTAATITVNYAWGVIGQVNGSSWDKDLWLRKNGKDTFESAAFIANGGFKLRAAGDWGANRGGTFVAYDEAFAVTHDGANIELPTADAKVKLVYDSAAETITVSAVE